MDLGGFVPNDRQVVIQNIQGMHFAASVLTKQPAFQLNDQEAFGLTKSLCDVLDAHQINIVNGGGKLGLYVALGITAFGVYMPRLKAAGMLGKKGPRNITPQQPTTVSEAANAVTGGIQMDFTNDADPQAAH